MRIAILAALPGELKPLVKGWQSFKTPPGIYGWRKSTVGEELIAVCAGMGSDAARRSFAAAEAVGPLDRVLSVGWAGALVPQADPGTCYRVSEIIDAQTGERFNSGRGFSESRLVTTAHVAGAAEKLRLASSYGAVLVDMEAAAIARLAQMRGIPIACFKAVSDGVDARLPDLNRFIDPQGQMKMLAFLSHVSVRPRFWSPLGRLGRTSATAAQQLARAITAFLDAERSSRINERGDPA